MPKNCKHEYFLHIDDRWDFKKNFITCYELELHFEIYFLVIWQSFTREKITYLILNLFKLTLFIGKSLPSSSTISWAVGRLVGVILKQARNRLSLYTASILYEKPAKFKIHANHFDTPRPELSKMARLSEGALK